jgi:hypothetical protein
MNFVAEMTPFNRVSFLEHLDQLRCFLDAHVNEIGDGKEVMKWH